MPRRPKGGRVLVVDDDRLMGEMVADGLAERGYATQTAGSSDEALALFRGETFDAIVTDLRTPQVDGLALMSAARRASPDVPLIVMTAPGAVDAAIDSVRRGANHYLIKPIKLEELAVFLDRLVDERRVRREAHAMRAALRHRPPESRIIGASQAMDRVFDLVDRMAPSDLPVLLRGETGTGKGMFARFVHARSDRAAGPFVAVHCGDLPERLLDSELFGYVKGAFAGATRNARGAVAEASSGTLFLDEIAELSPPLQAKLLAVLERGIGGTRGSAKELTLDVRTVAATRKDLAARVAAGTFREDLYRRLNVVSIELPALRHRREDILLLLEHYLREARGRHPMSPAERLAPAAAERLIDYAWPGNVRELCHAVERMVILAKGPEIRTADLPPWIPTRSHALSLEREVMPIRDVQRRYATWALEQFGGQRAKTAERLGIDGKTLAKWLSEADTDRKSAE